MNTQEAAAADQIFCSKCARFYAADEFQINKKGKLNKTCRRHSRKRSLELDEWENFILLLRNWKRQASILRYEDERVQVDAYTIETILTCLLLRTDRRY
jgi:hypothetical protein